MNIRSIFALLVLTSAATAQAADLGRLFFTPEERARMDRQQVLSADEAGNDSRALVVNGMIQRDGGKRIIWINGEQQAAGSADSLSPASVPVVLPGKMSPVQVKVGQRLMLDVPEANPQD